MRIDKMIVKFAIAVGLGVWFGYSTYCGIQLLREKLKGKNILFYEIEDL